MLPLFLVVDRYLEMLITSRQPMEILSQTAHPTGTVCGLLAVAHGLAFIAFERR